MAIKRTPQEKTFDSVNIAIMVFMILITFYPFWHVLMASMSNSNRLLQHNGIMLLPEGFSGEAYRYVLQNRRIYTGYFNTLFVVVVGTAFNLLMTSLGAYVLSRKNFAARKTMTVAIIFTMYFSGGMIPRYILINNTLGLKNTLWALILPGLVSTWNLIVMRTAFFGVPESIEESARLDGANDFVILFRVILPTIMSTVAVIILFYAVGHWNAWFDAALFLRKKEKYPLQLVLREILILSSTDSMTSSVDYTDKEAIGESIKYATIIVTTLPVICIYPFLQRYFVKGVMIGAVKG
ncbi:MAG: carbohydrate ABC transporter permease [Provencibacterium sp.]|nr:carbohydrate ABC transporter permease [Provencibacterium sp.]